MSHLEGCRLMRPHLYNLDELECTCSDLSDHDCDSGHFDRTVCAEPCGVMHSYCYICGNPADDCYWRSVTQP